MLLSLRQRDRQFQPINQVGQMRGVVAILFMAVVAHRKGLELGVQGIDCDVGEREPRLPEALINHRKLDLAGQHLGRREHVFMRAEDDVCVLRGLFLGLVAALVIKRTKDRFLAPAALSACRPLDIGPNCLCRGNSLQVQAQRLAGGEIGGLPGLPKRGCDALWQALARFLAQFVGGDEDENTVRDGLPFPFLFLGLRGIEWVNLRA